MLPSFMQCKSTIITTRFKTSELRFSPSLERKYDGEDEGIEKFPGGPVFESLLSHYERLDYCLGSVYFLPILTSTGGFWCFGHVSCFVQLKMDRSDGLWVSSLSLKEHHIFLTSTMRSTCQGYLSWSHKRRAMWSQAALADLQACSCDGRNQCFLSNACSLCRSCWLIQLLTKWASLPHGFTSLVSSDVNWDGHQTHFEGGYFHQLGAQWRWTPGVLPEKLAAQSLRWGKCSVVSLLVTLSTRQSGWCHVRVRGTSWSCAGVWFWGAAEWLGVEFRCPCVMWLGARGARGQFPSISLRSMEAGDWWMSLSRSRCLPWHSGANAIMSPEPLRRLLGLCFPTTGCFLVNDSRFRTSFHLPPGQSSAGWLPQGLEQMEECWCSPAEQISPFRPQCPGRSGVEAIPTGRAIIIPAAVIKLLPGTPPWLPRV